MTSIMIATENRTKIKAIEDAFVIFFFGKESTMRFDNAYADSGVSRQPFDDDVFIGAENRLKSIKKDYNADYYIACESGIVKIFNTYYNVQYVIIEDKDGKRSTGLSQGFPVPEEYIDEIKATSLACVMDRIFNGEGGIRKLTNNLFTREKLIHDATVMALTGMINNQWRITSS